MPIDWPNVDDTTHATRRAHWQLDPEVAYLNHGSFGATPTRLLQKQRELQDLLERQPVHFYARLYPEMAERARQTLADFLGCDAEGLGFVQNGTAGANTVLRSLRWQPGDAVLTTSQDYPGCRGALEHLVDRFGVTLQSADVPFPVSDPGEITQRILDAVTPKTKVALIDHVTSFTGMRFPVEDIVPALEERGVMVLLDGAHAPGQVPVNLASLNPSFFFGNCHKWLCSPKAAALLWVREDRRELIRPLVISLKNSQPLSGRSRYRADFDWPGPIDPTPFLCTADAITLLPQIAGGSWDDVRGHNHQLAVAARRLLCERLECEAPTPDDMIGSLASVVIPDRDPLPGGGILADHTYQALWNEHQVEAPVFVWPKAPQRLLRISAQLYNHQRDYERLADALPGLV